ncbi:MAG: hypothetical protein V2A73_06930 [Pseudomonadota bacterium]
MLQPLIQAASAQASDRERALRIIAKSLFKELRAQGFGPKQIVSLATELIEQVTVELNSSAQS